MHIRCRIHMQAVFKQITVQAFLQWYAHIWPVHNAMPNYWIYKMPIKSQTARKSCCRLWHPIRQVTLLIRLMVQLRLSLVSHSFKCRCYDVCQIFIPYLANSQQSCWICFGVCLSGLQMLWDHFGEVIIWVYRVSKSNILKLFIVGRLRRKRTKSSIYGIASVRGDRRDMEMKPLGDGNDDDDDDYTVFEVNGRKR